MYVDGLLVRSSKHTLIRYFLVGTATLELKDPGVSDKFLIMIIKFSQELGNALMQASTILDPIKYCKR